MMNESRGSENPGAKKGRGAQRLPAELSRVNLNAAGIDVGASSHFVAVPEAAGNSRCANLRPSRLSCTAWPTG